MAESRREIREQLRQLGRQVVRSVRPWLPVDREWSGPKPDHAYYIRPDFSPCCEWHDMCVAAQLQRDHSDDPSWSKQTFDHFNERFGA